MIHREAFQSLVVGSEVEAKDGVRLTVTRAPHGRDNAWVCARRSLGAMAAERDLEACDIAAVVRF